MLKRAMTYTGAFMAALGCLAATATAAAPPAPTATNGNTVQVVAAGLNTPTSFAFGDGQVFESDFGNQATGKGGGVFVLSHGTATLVPGSPAFAFGLAWHKGKLYVSSGNELMVWSGWNGTKFATQKVIVTEHKGFPGFNGIAFGPDGRLYAGVDLGQTNDHGPVTKQTPYLYDVLSFDANGKHPEVFATGIRQPWQLAFASGDKKPFVTDLGQDKVAKNAPDFLLHVSKGDVYGFPQCNRTSAKPCKGFTKPFRLFAPHSDIGGIGISGKTIYLSEFGFASVPPAIVSLSAKGGKVKTVVDTHGVPVIGLGVNKGWIYFGEVTGFIYRVHS
jgi:glucose/arabinose dehydrogenase